MNLVDRLRKAQTPGRMSRVPSDVLRLATDELERLGRQVEIDRDERAPLDAEIERLRNVVQEVQRVATSALTS
jgi:hypothetical protein